MRYVKCLLMALLAMLVTQSCDDDEPEYVIEYKIYTNPSEAIFHVSGYDVRVKGEWVYKVRSKSLPSGCLEISTLEENVGLTAELWVNDKLKKREQSVGYLRFGLSIKSGIFRLNRERPMARFVGRFLV